jgi:hypothetical protein
VAANHTTFLLGLNSTRMLSGAISTTGPVQMKENSAFSFMIEHHRWTTKWLLCWVHILSEV